MLRVLLLLRRASAALGNGGAVANAGALGAQRRHEAWVVASLERSVTRAVRSAPARRTA